jgi:hypothetical protein
MEISCLLLLTIFLFFLIDDVLFDIVGGFCFGLEEGEIYNYCFDWWKVDND